LPPLEGLVWPHLGRSLPSRHGRLLSRLRHIEKLQQNPQVEQFWAVQGNRIEKHLQTAAVEVIAAFQAYSLAGLVADASDRHLITEAQRLVAEGG
jgi:hypothetical protein